MIDPERAEALEADRIERDARIAHARRSLVLVPDHHGSMLIRGQVPVADGELLLAQLDALMPSAASYRLTGEVPDRPARRADALMRLCGITANCGQLPDVGGDRPQVLRDQGCAFPGCDAPPAACEAHHTRPWWAGGTTCLTNGVLLCPYHHRLVEPDPNKSARVQWQILIDPATGLPWFTPPHQIDPDRVPRLHHRFLIKGISPPTLDTDAVVEKCATLADLVPSPHWHS